MNTRPRWRWRASKGGKNRATGAGGLTKQPQRGRMNKTEDRFHREVLLPLLYGGQAVQVVFESVKFKIGHNCWYTPDFRVTRSDGEVVFYEVKGFWRDDALVKIRAAAEHNPYRFYAVEYCDKRWKYREFTAWGEASDGSPKDQEGLGPLFEEDRSKAGGAVQDEEGPAAAGTPGPVLQEPGPKEQTRGATEAPPLAARPVDQRKCPGCNAVGSLRPIGVVSTPYGDVENTRCEQCRAHFGFLVKGRL